ncbi:MAG: PAS domain-containing protein [Myxococcota bacterium]
MAATVDLPPGARSRMWILLIVTAIGGYVTYALFGHVEILIISGLVLGILLYLLAGVALALGYDRQRLGPVVQEIVDHAAKDPSDELWGGLWAVLASNGTVLYVSPQGAQHLGHDPKILTGQRLTDLVPSTAIDDKVRLNEQLQSVATLGAAGPRSQFLLISEAGERRCFCLQLIAPPQKAAQRTQLVLLTGQHITQVP